LTSAKKQEQPENKAAPRRVGVNDGVTENGKIPLYSLALSLLAMADYTSEICINTQKTGATLQSSHSQKI
jgi:hypothetical protein